MVGQSLTLQVFLKAENRAERRRRSLTSHHFNYNNVWNVIMDYGTKIVASLIFDFGCVIVLSLNDLPPLHSDPG